MKNAMLVTRACLSGIITAPLRVGFLFVIRLLLSAILKMETKANVVLYGGYRFSRAPVRENAPPSRLGQ